MKRVAAFSLAVLAAAAVYPLVPFAAQAPRTKPLQAPEETAFRILFGVGDTAPASWDGTVRITPGRVTSIKGWRFGPDDSTDYQGSWKVATRHSAAQIAAAKKGGKLGTVLENGVIVGGVTGNPTARFNVKTAQGAFSFAARDIPMGVRREFLSSRVLVERVPSTAQLTTSDEDEDFPALAQSGDEVWVAFVQFAHASRAEEDRRRRVDEPLKSFELFARPAGGDQVFVMRYLKSKNTWGTPMAVSAPRQDIMRAAVAVDGRKRVWVIWSAARAGNYDLYARVYANGAWSPEMRVTTNPGTDVNPVAATDSQGRVWIAWQGYRGGNLDVLAAVQEGDRFTPETRVSVSPASDWDPAIAAGPGGQVAVSWDTYDKGDYDVYVRVMRAEGAIRLEAPLPVAASPAFEARSTLAFDPRGRLWVAYETSSTGWGKDFSTYETSGVPLYASRNIQVRCLEAGKLQAPAEDLQAVLPAMSAIRRASSRAPRAIPPAGPAVPNPALAAKRRPGAVVALGSGPLNAFPRLAVDPEGMVYLAYRAPADGFRSIAGAVWVEYLVYWDGVRWHGPVFVPRTDGLLGNRPAMAALTPGRVLMVTAMDHRQSEPAGGRQRILQEVINSDLYAAQVRIEQRPQPPRWKSLPPETPAAPEPAVKAEAAQVAMMRRYRAKVGAENLQVLRGDYHRHTEFSAAGGRDGSLADAYRYLIDAAALDWGACNDHDAGGGHEYFWWLQQKHTDAYRLGGRYIPMFGHERAVRYPEGHRGLLFARRGIRPLPRLPKMADDSPATHAPDTQMLYRYLRQFGGVSAVHTPVTAGGTDWRDNDPLVEPVVEIYQGYRQSYEAPGAPRAASEKDSIGGWRPAGFVSQALHKGYRLGFVASSSHISTHQAYTNVWVKAPTREAILEGLRKRRVYGSTDNILAEVRSGDHFMGDEFTVNAPPSFTVKLWGTAPFTKVHIIKDGRTVHTAEPRQKVVNLTWRDNAAARGRTSYYYVRGEQADGELVWVSPMWITYR